MSCTPKVVISPEVARSELPTWVTKFAVVTRALGEWGVLKALEGIHVARRDGYSLIETRKKTDKSQLVPHVFFGPTLRGRHTKIPHDRPPRYDHGVPLRVSFFLITANTWQSAKTRRPPTCLPTSTLHERIRVHDLAILRGLRAFNPSLARCVRAPR